MIGKGNEAYPSLSVDVSEAYVGSVDAFGFLELYNTVIDSLRTEEGVELSSWAYFLAKTEVLRGNVQLTVYACPSPVGFMNPAGDTSIRFDT